MSCPARRAPAPGYESALLQGRQHSPTLKFEVYDLEKAFVLLTIEIGSDSELMESLKEIPEVKKINQLYGVYDLIIHVEAETMQELKDVINNRIKGMGKIMSNMSMICI